MQFVDEQVAKGKNVPTFLKDKYESPEDRPSQDYAWGCYDRAYARLSWQKPIAFTEMQAYHKAMKVPYPLGVFVDAMRSLEIDDMQAQAPPKEVAPPVSMKHKIER